MNTWQRASLLVVASLLGCGSVCHLFSQSSKRTLYWSANPNSNNTLDSWNNFNIGDQTYTVSDHRQGFQSVGGVSVVNDPLKTQGKVYKLLVGPRSNFQSIASESDRVDLWNNASAYLGQEGQEDWEHVRLMFPSFGEGYHPTDGDWNWLLQHHNDSKFTPFVKTHAFSWEYPELVWGVNTHAKLSDGTYAPELFMRVWGGDDTKPGNPTIVYPDAALRYDHWYDMLVHVVWSHESSKGLVEWWLDGNLLFSQHTADVWQRPDGTTDHLNFEFSNYRKHSQMESAVFFSQVKIGPTKASVEF